MTNLILNIVADGTFQELDAAVIGFPERARAVSLQARTNVDMYYRYVNQDTFWTIKAGTARTITFGEIWPHELFVQAAVGTVIEIEVSTQLTI
jgi:hypothetical protein